jgi:hypothetical protein
MPGPLKFQLIRQDYMTARIYYLLGEWPKDVLRGQPIRGDSIGRYESRIGRHESCIGHHESCYSHELKCQFAHRCRIQTEDHCPGDVDWRNRVDMLCNGQSISEVEQLGELRVRGNLARGLRRRYASVEAVTVTRAIRRDPALAIVHKWLGGG